MPTRMTANLSIDARDTIGEGPTWDASGQRFLWSDNAVGLIREAKCDDAGTWRESRQWKLNRSTGAALVRENGGLIIVAGTDVLALSEAGDVTPFARIEADAKRVQLNDAKCDPQGRLWVGTQAYDFTRGICAFYRIDPDGTVTTILEQVGLSNGIDWSPDGATMYYIDSFTHSIDAFDFDASRGAISRPRAIVTIPLRDGGFDGMCVDREGCLWAAVFGAGEVRRYSPNGEWLASVEISAPAVTSCAFGGPGGEDLMITSAAIRIPDGVLPIIGGTREMAERSASAPGAGGIFVCRPGVTGKPATPFAG
jgi:sugar lactone lactonase YvrE